MKKVALFGAGRIGQIHGRNLAALSGIKLTYIVDPVAESSQKLASELGATVVDSQAVFADATIDAVVIGSPSAAHHEVLMQAARSGKAVFCEKPVDLTSARAAECAAALKANNVPCMVGFQRRFDPTFNRAKERLDAGEIGLPEMLILTSRDPGPPPLAYLKDSGGIFNDMLIHDFDVMRWILCGDGDTPEWLVADGSCITDPAYKSVGDIGSAIVNIRTKKGRLAQINAQRRASYGYDQRIEILGSAGMLQCVNHKPTEVVCSTSQGISIDTPENFFLQRYRLAYQLEIAHFFDCLQTGKAFRTTIEDGVAAQRMAEAATQSWQQQVGVAL